MAISLLGTLCLAQGNFFIGGGTGSTVIKDEAGVLRYFMNLNLQGGYELYVNEKHGLRTYLNATYGFAPMRYSTTGANSAKQTRTQTSQILNLDINLDYLYRFVDTGKYSMGIYTGVFLGMLAYGSGDTIDSQTSNGTTASMTTPGSTLISYNTGFNLGFETTIAKKHSILAGAKLLGLNGLFNGQNLALQVNYLYRF